MSGTDREGRPGEDGTAAYRPPTPGDPGRPGLAARLARLFTSPRTAFQPPLGRSVWITALILLAAMQFTQAILLRDITREQVISGIERNDRIGEEQKESIIAQMETGYDDPGRFALQALWGVIGALLVSYLLVALIYHLALNFGLGARVPYGEVLGVVTFSALIFLVRDALRLPLMMSKETLYVFTSPAAFIDPNNRLLLTVLDRFDLFALFRLVLLTFGLASVSGLPPARTVVPVIVIWVLTGLLVVGFMLSPIGKMFG